MESESLPDIFKLVRKCADDTASHILRHLSTVQPRQEDIDAFYNEGAAGESSIANGATDTITITAKDGYTLHVTAVRIVSTVPADALTGVEAYVLIDGKARRISLDHRFSRPLTVDREGKLTIHIVNGSGAQVDLEYSLRGWLRQNTPVQSRV